MIPLGTLATVAPLKCISTVKFCPTGDGVAGVSKPLRLELVSVNGGTATGSALKNTGFCARDVPTTNKADAISRKAPDKAKIFIFILLPSPHTISQSCLADSLTLGSNTISLNIPYGILLYYFSEPRFVH